jgi:hypothetical protein
VRRVCESQACITGHLNRIPLVRTNKPVSIRWRSHSASQSTYLHATESLS